MALLFQRINALKKRMRDGQPLHARQFRIPFAHEETIFDYVDELLRRGAIEVSR
jgi:hypothetical protein